MHGPINRQNGSRRVESKDNSKQEIPEFNINYTHSKVLTQGSVTDYSRTDSTKKATIKTKSAGSQYYWRHGNQDPWVKTAPSSSSEGVRSASKLASADFLPIGEALGQKKNVNKIKIPRVPWALISANGR